MAAAGSNQEIVESLTMPAATAAAAAGSNQEIVERRGGGDYPSGQGPQQSRDSRKALIESVGDFSVPQRQQSRDSRKEAGLPATLLGCLLLLQQSRDSRK